MALRTPADEARAPKYAQVERERRWLIDGHALPMLGPDHVLVEDRYIIGTRLRLRRMTAVGGAVSLKLTRKYEAGDPLPRAIVTAYLEDGEYAVVATLPAWPLEKRRYHLGGYTFDRFLGMLDGLVVAEIEAPNDRTLRGLPPPPAALREVSDDPRYEGGELARYGLPEESPWPASSSLKRASTIT